VNGIVLGLVGGAEASGSGDLLFITSDMQWETIRIRESDTNTLRRME
jgi:hypothetical protein